MSDTVSIDDREFGQFQTWLYRAAGISLSPAKKALVAGRLFKRLKHYELHSYGEYFKLIMSDPRKSELQVALDLLTTNETYFFREPKHFDFLRQHVLPKAAPGAAAAGHCRAGRGPGWRSTARPAPKRGPGCAGRRSAPNRQSGRCCSRPGPAAG